MAPSLLNGERAVVLVFIVRMLCSAPFSLLLRESVALSLLAVSALFVEVCVDESSVVLTKLNSRIGTSSGILLGGVTLPAVMFSKLIQLSRTLSSKEIELEEFEYQKVLYWVTSTSCFSVLVFLSLVIQRSSSQRYASTNSTWKLQFGFIGIMLCAVLYFLGSPAESYYGFKWLSIIGHGVATVLLIQRILRTFPSCASIGEALLVTAGLAAYSGDMLRSTLAKILKYLLPNALNVQHGVRRSEISTVIQAYLLGLLLFPRVFKFADRILDRFTSSSFYNSSRCNHFRTSVLFFGFLAVNIIVIIPLWMQFVQDFQVHPLMWVLMFIFSEPVKRLSLCIYWVIVICVSVCRFYFISKSSKIERILLRKYYHLMAVSMFVPALILQPKFLNLAFGVALAVFLILEIIRVWRIWPCGEIIHQFMNAFTDHRDSDLLIVSHFSLLLGCALPIWMSSGFNDRPLAPFAGILSLGIGDTMASMVGHKYGVLRWSKTGKKTIEGTAAGITSVLAACFVLLPLLALTGYIPKQNLSSLLFAVTLSGLLEAYTAQLDNAFIPLVFYSLLCL